MVNANGFGSAFMHETLDRVAWAGGGFTAFVTSYEGMKQVAVAAQTAAEEAASTAGAEAAVVATAAIGDATADATAAATSAATAQAAASASATAAANSAALVGAPADAAIAAAINGASATKAALNATFDQRYTKAFVPMTRETNHPRARKPLAAPIFTQAMSPAPSIYWPWLVDRAAAGGTGIDIHYSTDHAVDNTTSGLYRAYSPTGPLGAFTSIGRYFRDSVDGTQTETPSVVWDKATSQYLIYYQQKGVPGSIGAQQTMLATGNAALSNVTRSKVMLDMASTNDPGDGHQGYFKPFAIGGRNYGYHLNGGEDYGRYGLSRSEDGQTWNTDPQQIGAQIPYLRQFGASVVGTPGTAAQTTAAKSNNIGWKSFLGCPIEWKGRVWWIGLVGPRSSGATVTVNKIVAAPLREDLMGIAEPPIDITPPTQAWEGTGISGFSNIIEYDGKFYAAYQANGAQGGFGLLEIF
jgi:hypothetical protein